MAILQYDISVVGLANVDKAFAHVRRKAVEANRAAAGLGASGTASAARRAGTMADPVARAQVAHAKRIDTMREASARRIASFERSSAQQIERERARTRMRELRDAIRVERDAQRAKHQEALNNERRKLAQLRSSNAIAAANGRNMRGVVGRAALDSATGIGRSALSVAAMGGTALISNALYQQGKEQAVATQLANQAGTPGAKQQVLKASQGYAGFTGDEVMAGLSKFVEKTGDLESGLKLMKELTQLSLATGSSLEDLGEAAGAAFNPTADAIADPVERLASVKRQLRQMAGAGGIGTIEMADMAREGAAFAAQASRFAGGPEKTMMELNAAAQAAARRGGASSSAEAATALARFGSDAITKEKLLREKLGVDVFTDDSRTQMKSYADLVKEIVGKSGGRLDIINEIFGERGARIVGGFQPLYAEAERKQKGSGMAAVQAEFDKFINATLSDGDVRERAQSRLADPDLQVKEAMKLFNQRVGTELLPVVTELIPAFADLLKGVSEAAPYVKWFAEQLRDNPIGTIGKVIAAKVALDVGKAAIGDAITRVITGQLASGAAGGQLSQLGASAATASAGLGALGVAAVGVGAGLAAIIAVMNEATGARLKGQRDQAGREISGMNAVNSAHAALRAGRRLTPAQRKALEAEREKIEGAERSRDQAIKNTSSIGGILGVLGNSVTGDGPGFGKTVTALESGPSKTDLRNLSDINRILAEDSARGLAASEKIGVAADKLNDAAAKLATADLNRGNKPSPVK